MTRCLFLKDPGLFMNRLSRTRQCNRWRSYQKKHGSPVVNGSKVVVFIDHGHHTSVGKGTLGMPPMLYLHDRAGPLRAMPLPLWQLSALAGLGIGPRHAGRWSNFVSGSAGTLGLSDASSTHVHHPSRDSVGSTKPSLLDRFTAIFKRRSF